MRNRHRSRGEIIASILQAVNGNSLRQTEILYRTYLSHNLLKEYLVNLLENELIEYTAGERTFKTTGKGMRYLRMYAELGQLIVKHNSKYAQSDASSGDSFSI
jgi:predicted transcriptional regulator